MRTTTSPEYGDPTRTTFSWRTLVLPWFLVCLAWTILLLASTFHYTYLFNHDYLLRSGQLSWWLALLLFLLSWQIMIAAMMLPSSLSAVASPTSAMLSWPLLWKRQLTFLAGYTVVWTAFALLAFLGDTVLHWLVAHWQWLYLHSTLISTGILAVAGIFQLLPWKRHCLQECMAPTPSILMRESAWAENWRLGLRYGRFCLGSCWAIMLVMIAMGMQDLAWLALLAVVILLEKEWPGGAYLRPWIGVALLGGAVYMSIFSW